MLETSHSNDRQEPEGPERFPFMGSDIQMQVTLQGCPVERMMALLLNETFKVKLSQNESQRCS